ncbi:MAG TPA: hypothetical protein ENG54_00400 [Thermofilum sp.]|nr:hypothetical protein [Thermofilum sp.]
MESKSDKAEKIVFEGTLKDDMNCVVTDPAAVAYLSEKRYGMMSEHGILLEPLEALYLLRRGNLILKDAKGSTVEFKQLLIEIARKDPDIWVKLELYTDLRKRGFYVRTGFSEGIVFLVDQKKGEKFKKYLVYGFTEGKRVGFSEFEEVFRRAIESGREPLIAVIDKESNITYYSVSKME